MDVLDRVMTSVARQAGNKFVYRGVDPDRQIPQIRKALDLLVKARLCHRVVHTAGTGLPLGAESNEKFFKALFLDTGLLCAQLGLAAMKRKSIRSMILANKGGIAEHFVGQQLRASQALHQEPKLFYWQRIGGRQGEVDYITQHDMAPVPIEVKAGAAGSMKSLHHYMHDRRLALALRCDTNPLSVMEVSVKTTLGDPVAYRLLSLPLYMAESIPRLCKDL